MSNTREHSEKHEKLLKLAEMSLGEISTLAKTGDGDEIETCVEKVSALIKRLENSIEKTKEAMLDGDVPLEEIVTWSKSQAPALERFREERSQLKQGVIAKRRDEDEAIFRRELEKQRAINEEATRAKIHEQQEIDAIAERTIQREEEWLGRKIQMEKEAKQQMVNANPDISASVQSVKLQKYTI